MAQAQEKNIDPWVFHSIIFIESRWSWWALRRETDGTCSVGLGQINVKCDSSAMRELRDPKKNIEAVGNFLGKLKTRCEKRPNQKICDNLGWLIPYNAGNPQYIGWVRKRVSDEHVRYPQPSVSEVQTEVLVERVRRNKDD